MTANALDVLAEVRRHGGDVRVIASDRLRVVAPPALLPAFAARVQAVKVELLRALAKLDGRPSVRPEEWRGRHAEALAYWQALHCDEEAASIAWGEMVNLWHERHAKRSPPWQCAGCREPIRHTPALPLSDGTRVHFGDDLTCVLHYGDRWRSAATRALIAMGLRPPDKDARE